MKRIRFYLIFFLLTLCAMACRAADADTQTRIFAPSFHSLQVKIADNDQLPAVLIMDSSDHIVISFDEIADERRYMRYEIVHCNARWQPDALVSSIYMDGFNVNDVEEYYYSQATTVNYMHYRIVIPNDKVRLRVSGNYLLKVYDETDPDTVLLQARFQVSENTVGVYGSVTPRTDIDYQKSHQQLSLLVQPKTGQIMDPYRDLMLTVQQNGRTDNMRTLTAPMRIAGDRLYYEHLPELIFTAGNEYRRFETVTVNYPSMRVEQMSYAHPYYHADLYVDEPRSEGKYIFDKTQHGRYRVRQFNSDESDTEADYVMTHFTLDMDELPGYDIFVDGDLAMRNFDPESRMHFDRRTGRYSTSMLLKQGSYNYQYLAVPISSNVGETSVVEGDYYQTINEYSICVYFRKPGDLYDRLVGFADFLSN